MKFFKFPAFMLFVLALVTACTSRFQEGTPAASSSGTAPSVQNRMEAQKRISLQFDKIEKQVRKYKSLVGALDSMFDGESKLDMLQTFESVQDDARLILPTAGDGDKKYVIVGQVWISGLGDTPQCHLLEYRITSLQALLRYEFKTCYTDNQFLTFLEIKTDPILTASLNNENLRKIFPLSRIVEAVRGCSLLDFDGETRLSCDAIRITEDQKTFTQADIREVPEAYLITVEVVNKETGKVEKSGFLNYEKSGRIGDLIWN